MNTVEFYQLSEVAGFLPVKERTLRAICERGELPGAAKIGKIWLVNRAKLQEHLGVSLPEPRGDEQTEKA